MKRLLLALAVLCCAAPLWAQSAARERVLQEANRGYRDARYQEAYDGYASLLGTDAADGHLLYNLGNAAFRLDQVGRAILFYERARVLLPRDADLAFNLGHARERVRDVIPETESLVGSAFFWLGSLSLPEIFWLFAVVNILFWGVAAARLFSRAEWASSLLFILLAIWLLTGLSLGVKSRQMRTDDRAVILQAEVGVLAGPDIRDTLLFKLHEGTIVHFERSEGAWSLVRLPDGRRGWLRSEAAERIATSS